MLAEKETQKHREIKNGLLNILDLGYLIGIITCFICNLAIDHKLSWSLIVLVGDFMAFTITSLPFYLKDNKYKLCKISAAMTPLVYLLLFTLNYIYGGDWLLGSFLIASFALIFWWICVLVCTFTKIALNYKIAFCLLMLAVVTIPMNPFCAKVLNISDNESNIPNIACATVILVVASYLTLKQLFNKKLS